MLFSLVFSSCKTKKTTVNQDSRIEEPAPPPPAAVVIPADVFEIEEEEEMPSPVVERPAPPPPPPPPHQTREIFKVVEDMPRFPGCENNSMSKTEKHQCASQKLASYVVSNLQYPPIALENGVEGTCVVSFVINKTGAIDEIRLIRDIGAQCGQEAVRIVQKMKDEDVRWSPPKQRGRAVDLQYNLPIRFLLPDDK